MVSFKSCTRIVSVFHCVKSVLIRSYSGPHFPAFGLNTERYSVVSPNSVRLRENEDQNNSEYGHFYAVFKTCPLCLNEKLLIATSPDQKQLLKERSELIVKYWHENKFLFITNKARLIYKLFLNKCILYRCWNIFKRKLYLPEDCINLKLKVLHFSSCYFYYINDTIALFSTLSTYTYTFKDTK